MAGKKERKRPRFACFGGVEKAPALCRTLQSNGGRQKRFAFCGGTGAVQRSGKSGWEGAILAGCAGLRQFERSVTNVYIRCFSKEAPPRAAPQQPPAMRVRLKLKQRDIHSAKMVNVQATKIEEKGCLRWQIV